MPPETTGLHVNPSDETIRLGPLAVRFLLTGDDPTGSVAAFELAVPAAQHLAAPAHSHDHDERRHGLAGSAPASDVALLPPMQDVNINDECGIDAFRQSSAE